MEIGRLIVDIIVDMLSCQHRLKKEKDIKRALRGGEIFKERALFLRRVFNGLACTRFGLVISLKVSKKATFRNKIRRQITEIIRLKLPRIKKGFDIMVLVLPEAAKLDFKNLEETINKLLSRAKLIAL